MHCFIGIDVQTPLSTDIIGLQRRWHDLDLPPADFHKHTDPHITLVPPFECKEPGELATQLKVIGANFHEFSLQYSHVAAFNRRIIHLSLDSNAIVELRSRLLVACAEFTRVYDSNPFFHPHTTLGYAHQPLTTRQQTIVAETLERALSLPIRQEVDTFILYGRSRPGVNYAAQAEIQLNQQVVIE